MSICRNCGTEIDWVRKPDGGYIPVDPEGKGWTTPTECLSCYEQEEETAQDTCQRHGLVCHSPADDERCVYSEAGRVMRRCKHLIWLETGQLEKRWTPGNGYK